MMSEYIVVCGLGSMGQRRLRILTRLYPEFKIIGVDHQEKRCQQIAETFQIEARQNYEESLNEYKPVAVFVCTDPKYHPEIVIKALEAGAHTFSEINLSPRGYDTIQEASARYGKTAFLSSTSLYREETKWIIERVKKESPVFYRYHVGQFLPDWHPWENYKDFFLGDKEGSACKEIMAIDFPWLIRAFGQVKTYKVVKSKMSDLDLDYPDIWYLIFEHDTGNIGSLTIDCISAKAVRELEVFSDRFYLTWEGTPDSLKLYSRETKEKQSVPLYQAVEKQTGYEDFVIENPYVEEVKAFFSVIQDPVTLKQWYGYEEDLALHHLIEKLDND